MNRRIVYKIIFSINVFLLIFFSILLVITLNQDVNDHFTNSFKYNFLRKNPITDETKKEIKTKFHTNVISYQTSDISNFGIDEYECVGSCYCMNERKTISSTTMVSRSLFFFVSSVTSYYAISKAKEYFQSKCILETEEESCETGSIIMAKVDSCDKVINKKVEKDKVVVVDDIDYVIQEQHMTRQYFCKGYCLTSNKLKSEYTKEKAKEFDCSKLEREGEVFLEMKKLSYKINKNDKKPVKVNYIGKVNAKEVFIQEYLSKYCSEKSLEGYMRESPSGQSNFSVFRKCVAKVTEKGKTYGKNPSVVCKRRKKKEKKEYM